MIIARPTRYAAGITLYGDWYDLRRLYDTVHYLSDSIPLEGDLSQFVRGLALEFWHAYKNLRETRVFGSHDEDRVTYRGVSILWPFFLVQLGLLRRAASFKPTTRDTQSDLYRLEACAEGALTSYDPTVGKRCFDWLTSFHGFPTTYLIQFVPHCSLQYVTVGKGGKARFDRLPDILRMIDPMSSEYRAFEEQQAHLAPKQSYRPGGITDIEEWPKFRW